MAVCYLPEEGLGISDVLSDSVKLLIETLLSNLSFYDSIMNVLHLCIEIIFEVSCEVLGAHYILLFVDSLEVNDAIFFISLEI